MSKNTLLSNLINYISANSSGNVVIAAPSSGYALDVTGTGRFTGAVTFSANVGIGTASPTKPLYISSTVADKIYLTGGTVQNGILLDAVGSSAQYYYGAGNNLLVGGDQGAIVAFNVSTSTAAIFFDSNNNIRLGATPSTERMRITSGGDILVGTTTNIWTGTNRGVIHLNGATDAIIGITTGGVNSGYIYHTGSIMYINQSKAGATMSFTNESNTNPMTFATNNAERMRFLAGGQILMHATSYNSAVSGQFFGVDGQTYFTVNNNVFTDATLALNRLNADGPLLSFQKNTTQTGFISTNTYSLPSDINFKKNISTLDLGLNLITKLIPVSYNHKIDDDDAALSTGFIAQELEQSLNELGIDYNKYYILQHKPNEKVGESQYWLDYTKMIPVLTKAIQEQQAQIEELKQLINN